MIPQVIGTTVVLDNCQRDTHREHRMQIAMALSDGVPVFGYVAQVLESGTITLLAESDSGSVAPVMLWHHHAKPLQEALLASGARVRWYPGHYLMLVGAAGNEAAAFTVMPAETVTDCSTTKDGSA